MLFLLVDRGRFEMIEFIVIVLLIAVGVLLISSSFRVFSGVLNRILDEIKEFFITNKK
jgi:hypothetical protein